MRFQNICFFLVVTTNLVSAAPAAFVMMEESVAVQPRVKRNPALQQTDFKCSAPGIYADQETGCQVFHICQDGGRMDSFFCPNLTLFNQRFFVCDWSYNVDCDSAHLYFSLNSALYLSPDTISNAIKPAIRLVQDDPLKSHPSVLESPESPESPEPTLETSSSQLDASIVQNSITGPLDYTKPTSQEKTPERNIPETIKTEETTTEVSENVPSLYYDDVADPEPSTDDTYIPAPLPTYTSQAGLNQVLAPLPTYSGITGLNQDIVLASLPSYSGLTDLNLQEKSLIYDDADPEPSDYYNYLSDPEPESFPASNSQSYYGGDILDLTGSQSVYLGDIADPEPDTYVLSNNNYPQYQDQGVLYDPLTDPEPSSDPEFTPYYDS